MKKLIWLLVAYRNLEQVDEYVDHLRGLPGHESFCYAICDNSPRPGVSRHADDPDVTFVSRPDNPGYLEGALVGLDAHVAAHEGRVPPWVALSNTDLEIRSGDPVTVLDGLPAGPLVVAPRITEGEDMLEKNPHVLERRSLRRLRANAWVARSVLTTMAYQGLSVARTKVSRASTGPRHDAQTWRQTHPAGTRFYAPYGALIFFSREFFEVGGLPRHVPLLSEEYFIAEAAADHGAPVVYRPDIHAHHSAHVTTGPKVTVARARGTARAFRAIYAAALERAGRHGA